MPRGKVFTEEEKDQLAKMEDSGCIMRAMLREIGRSDGVLRNFFRLKGKYGIKKHPRGNKIKTEKATRNKFWFVPDHVEITSSYQKVTSPTDFPY